MISNVHSKFCSLTRTIRQKEGPEFGLGLSGIILKEGATSDPLLLGIYSFAKHFCSLEVSNYRPRPKIRDSTNRTRTIYNKFSAYLADAPAMTFTPNIAAT